MVTSKQSSFCQKWRGETVPNPWEISTGLVSLWSSLLSPAALWEVLACPSPSILSFTFLFFSPPQQSGWSLARLFPPHVHILPNDEDHFKCMKSPSCWRWMFQLCIANRREQGYPESLCLEDYKWLTFPYHMFIFKTRTFFYELLFLPSVSCKKKKKNCFVLTLCSIS